MAGLVGQNLGSYRILQQIGLGGMATVYKAYHAAMDRYVAVKVLPQHLARDPSFRARFQREARTIARLEHRYILPVYDVGEEEGIPYLVMRYTASGDLSDLIANQALTIARAAWLISHVAEALAYAHRRGVIHRDVKPANVLLSHDGDVLLTDFGIAKIYEETLQLTGEGTMVGTPAYMAPEQLQGKTVDARTDLYALGVVLYQALTGECPFMAETPLALALMHIHNPLRPPRQLNPNIPEALERIVLRAMAKNPNDRFQTADELAEALRDALADLSRQTAVVAAPATEPPEGTLAPPAAPTPPILPAPTPALAAEPVTRQSRGAPHLRLWLAGAAVVALTIVLGVFLLKVITPYLSKQATEVPARLVETQVVATIPASQTSTVVDEQAVAVALTAEPITVVPPTDTPVPTVTKTPAVQATAVPPTPTAVPALTNADSIAGVWTGTVFPETNPNFSIQIDLSIQTGCIVGNVCGTVSTPQFPCSGNLALVAINGDTFVFVEQNMRGASVCASGGYEHLQLRSDGTLSWAFRATSASGEKIASNGVLRRP